MTQTTISKRYKLETQPPHLKLLLIKDLATGIITLTELAKQHDVSVPAMWEFKKRHAAEIAEQQKHLEDEMAAIWAARKANRLIAYQEEYERLNHGRNPDEHLASMARQSALRHIAEELGSIPKGDNVTVNVVSHQVVGVDVESYLK